MPTLYMTMVLLSCSQNGCPTFWSAIEMNRVKGLCEKPDAAERYVAGDGLRVIKWKCVEYRPKNGN